MTRNFLFVMMLFVGTLAAAQVIDTTVCDVLKDPQSFDGKIVRIKGTVFAGFDEFAIRDTSCKQKVNAIWLAYPEGTKAKAGPVASVQLQLAKNSPGAAAPVSRTPVKLDRNKDFKQFDSALSSTSKSGAMCLGCIRYTVTATLVGRLDGVKDAGAKAREGKFVAVSGFGNLNAYNARLVLQTVSDVVQQEIDYSKNSAATKGDTTGDSGGDPVAATKEAAKAFGPGRAADQLRRAAAAYGEPGEDNGVIVSFGVGNEVAGDEGAKGQGNSPDGLLLDCKFDMDRLKGDALSRAMAHVGTHIADVRGNPSTAMYELESAAWHTTVLSAVGSRQKTLTLPGAYLVWNAGWAADQRGDSVDAAITKYLEEWGGLVK